MRNFVGVRTFPEELTYHRPSTLEEALELLGEGTSGRKVIAGSTDVVPMVRRGSLVLPPGGGLVDVTRLPGFREIGVLDGRVHVGPAVTLQELTDSPLIRRHAPLLAQAAGKMASAQVRNIGTVGGNLCTASPGGDTAPPLLALEAEAVLRSAGGERIVALAEFFTGPGRTVLLPGELLTGLRFEAMAPEERSCYLKLGRRKTFTLAVVSVAARVAFDGNVIRKVRLALGAVAPTPLRARATERALAGRPFEPETVEAAARVLREEIDPRSSARASAEYRRDLAETLLGRALSTCFSAS
ncbi:MAG: xanthine dehydrogenase family protein subunit M [Deltaproteobacteria bacterium]|nr:xanthine dehydrogenase family protein subunit M [Deltaproteobacteria bacterium]